MRFLNTKYPNLFDYNEGMSNDGSNIYNNASSSKYVEKYISPTTTSVWVRFWYRIQRTGTGFFALLNIKTVNGSNLMLSETREQLKLSNSNNTFSYTYNVPAISSSNSRWERHILVHFDTVQNIANLYVNSVLQATIACANNGEDISSVLMGGVTSTSGSLFLNRIIISDTTVLPTENVAEITPTITSTDWTVSSGVATTDTVGGTMTLTAPSGSIDETARAVTGYNVAFLSCQPSEAINAIDVTQGATTERATLSSGGSVELADGFAVGQLSSISAVAEAAFV